MKRDRKKDVSCYKLILNIIYNVNLIKLDFSLFKDVKTSI